MPNKYAAVNCTSGYSYSKKGDVSKEEKEISFHKFPLRNPDLLRSWLHRLSLEGFVPTENSRLCSKHFVDGDFIKVSMDETEKPNDLLLVYIRAGLGGGYWGCATPPWHNHVPLKRIIYKDVTYFILAIRSNFAPWSPNAPSVTPPTSYLAIVRHCICIAYIYTYAIET